MIKKLIEMIEELDMEKQCIFSSTSYEYLKEIKGYDTDYHTGYIVAAGYGNYFDDENIVFSVLILLFVRSQHKSCTQLWKRNIRMDCQY